MALFYSSMKQITLALVGSKTSDRPLIVGSKQPIIRQYNHTVPEERVTHELTDEAVQRER